MPNLKSQNRVRLGQSQNINQKFSLKLDSKFLLLAFIIILLYFLTRLINLTIIPVFADEAIYVRWAQVMRAENTLRFLPLSDGKQPLFMWLTIPFLKIIRNPLLAGRLLSCLCGFAGMMGIFFLTHLLFKKISLSFFAAILYLIVPFVFFFDRMALADGLLSALGVWFLFFGVWLIREPRLDLAMIAGIILGLGLITKSPALFFVFLLPLTLILIIKKEKVSVHKMVFRLILWGIVYFFAFAIYNILRLGPEFQMIAIRNKDYVFSLSEVIKHPLNPLWGNFKDSISWFWVLLTPLVFILGFLGMLVMFKNNKREAFFLSFCFWTPLLAQNLIAKVNTARYLLFLVPIFLIFSAYSLNFIFESLKSKTLTTLFLIVVFLFPAYQSALLATAPTLAWLPEKDRNGYLEAWTAGWGIAEAAEYLKEVAKSEKVLVGTEGYFGTLPDGLQIYLEKVPNTTVIGVGYPIKEIPEKLTNGIIDNQVFLLVNDTRFEIKNTSGLKLIATYPKALNPKTGNRENLLFFEVLKGK